LILLRFQTLYLNIFLSITEKINKKRFSNKKLQEHYICTCS